MTQRQFQLPPQRMLMLLPILICLTITGWAQVNELQKQGSNTNNIAFKDAQLKNVLTKLGEQINFQLVIDESVTDSRISIDLQNVTIGTALKAVMAQQRLQARLTGEKTLVVFLDTEVNRQRYANYPAWTESSVESQKEKDVEGVIQEIRFKEASLRSVLATLGKQLDLNVVFDTTVKESKINLELNAETVTTAIKVVLAQQQLQARLLSDKTIIVFPNTEPNRQRFEQYAVWPE